MSSNTPYTYDDLSSRVQPGRERLPIVVRPNTEAWFSEDGLSFEVLLYGTRVTTLYADGSVRVNGGTCRSNTTKNRINDALLPLGWKIIGQPTEWKVRTTEPPYRWMEFVNDMILTSITLKKGYNA